MQSNDLYVSTKKLLCIFESFLKHDVYFLEKIIYQNVKQTLSLRFAHNSYVYSNYGTLNQSSQTYFQQT